MRSEPPPRDGRSGIDPCRWHRSTPSPRARTRTPRVRCRIHLVPAARTRRFAEVARSVPSNPASTPASSQLANARSQSSTRSFRTRPGKARDVEASTVESSRPLVGAWDSPARPIPEFLDDSSASAADPQLAQEDGSHFKPQSCCWRSTPAPAPPARPNQSSLTNPIQPGRSEPGTGSNSARQGRCVRPDRAHARMAALRFVRTRGSTSARSPRRLRRHRARSTNDATCVTRLAPSCLSLLVRPERQDLLRLTDSPQASLSLTFAPP